VLSNPHWSASCSQPVGSRGFLFICRLPMQSMFRTKPLSSPLVPSPNSPSQPASQWRAPKWTSETSQVRAAFALIRMTMADWCFRRHSVSTPDRPQTTVKVKRSPGEKAVGVLYAPRLGILATLVPFTSKLNYGLKSGLTWHRSCFDRARCWGIINCVSILWCRIDTYLYCHTL